MSYALSFSEPVAEAVDRVRRDQLEAAASELSGEVSGEDVHEARKRLKKTRALLRLTRPALKPKAFRARNRALRDAGRRLAGARAADVRAATVDDLAERYPGRAPSGPVYATLTARARATEPPAS